ncbi:PorP/SprF family type IX secretion system membrane protein [Marivirga sp. S37H4]|uniref:PorP/SprF family type IX secretion system membrane protein n=1 Tax=Marivirga aurantiaca TaxID=2802615 RepID=A0A934X091_9BACT|nr:PorP/SprF family type IX secretion system membrane protein [Marivirga aurantiaca]MBK6266092.1 PorP/SprF family type IX secretion system membrane protein [Marivirga aurantiaca]
MKKIFFTLLLCVTVFITKAQVFQVPNQYFVSPYSFNPAYAGLEGYTYIQLMHKQQWLGIENAPGLSNVAIQFPVKRRFNLGGNLFYDQNGLIKTTSAMVSGNFLIPFSPSQRLSFGLSGGFFNTEYDINNSSNPDDPAIANFNAAYNPVVSLGIAYYSPAFHVGVALPSLLGNTLINPEIPEKPYEVFYEQMIFSIGYKLRSPSGGIAFEPSAIYKMEKGVEDYMEFSGVLNFAESIYVGGSFRPEYGPSILFGFNLGALRFGYSYELAGEQVDQFGQGSHEFLVGLKIGKKKSFAVKKPKEKPVPVKKEPVVKEPVKKEVVEEPKEEVKPQVDTVKVEKPRPIIKKDPVPQKTVKPQPQEPEPKEVTYFVIIGAFNSLENANEYITKMQEEGFKEVSQIYNPKSGLNYVYILETKDVDEARAMRMVMRQTDGFDETWIYIREDN